MQSRILAAVAFATVLAAPFMASSAQAATCGTLSFSTLPSGAQEMTSAGCTVSDANGSVSFSAITVDMTVVNGVGQLTSLNVVPTFAGPNGHTEYGLALTYTADATGPNSVIDIAWTYTAAGNLLTDAYVSLTGGTSAGGSLGVTETITAPGISPAGFVTLSLTDTGAADTIFNPVSSAFVTKDEFTKAIPAGSSADSSVLVNAFSLTTTPLPAAVWMFGSVVAGAGGVAGWRRKRKAA